MTTLGLHESRCISWNRSSASCQRPAFSHALIRLLYVITLRSQLRATMSWKIWIASSTCPAAALKTRILGASSLGS